ncbi:probable leucine-rich repeat receptor-like serine/threonine-protein kinase At3g14840 [Trifolium pratense]|uniref:probable leucine-rich repeat receptor-like serine/threonine-protein kinase At3g14840 n=1 Tax=Trifolium pratense TaxID=57577 RepID=UPI001E693E02|nr:probable leucine-rich repeat receptor-like serine/threonine-protein kinase At3g14840 [Trifolium pratense]
MPTLNLKSIYIVSFIDGSISVCTCTCTKDCVSASNFHILSQCSRIEDNHFSGKIPDFIQNWKNIDTLIIQGSGLSGPIPSGISLLRNLTDLRISDLKGTESSPFPQLNNLILLNRLILRNCNINGKLPEYIGNLKALKHLFSLKNTFIDVCVNVCVSARAHARTHVCKHANIKSEINLYCKFY